MGEGSTATIYDECVIVEDETLVELNEDEAQHCSKAQVLLDGAHARDLASLQAEVDDWKNQVKAAGLQHSVDSNLNKGSFAPLLTSRLSVPSLLSFPVELLLSFTYKAFAPLPNRSRSRNRSRSQSRKSSHNRQWVRKDRVGGTTNTASSSKASSWAQATEEDEDRQKAMATDHPVVKARAVGSKSINGQIPKPFPPPNSAKSVSLPTGSNSS